MGEQTVDAFRRQRRTLLVRGVMEAGLYPLLIAAWAVILAVVVRHHYARALPPIVPLLLRDGLILAAVSAGIVPFILRYFHHRQRELRWLYYWCEVRARLEDGAAITTALERAHGTERVLPPGLIPRGIARGSDPSSLLRSAGCPRDYASLLAEATSEPHLAELLAHQLEYHQNATLRTLTARLRLAQPAGILGAGAVVAWVVGRVVRPALISYMQGLTL